MLGAMLSRLLCKIIEQRLSPRKHAGFADSHAFAVALSWFTPCK